MTRVINFDKSFKITVPDLADHHHRGPHRRRGVMGFNNGVDFQAGLNSTIQFVPPSMDVGFKGEGTMTLKVAKADATFISRAPSGESKSYTFAFAQYPTMQALADAFKTVPGVAVEPQGRWRRRFQAPPRRLADGFPARRQARRSSTTRPRRCTAVAASIESIRAALKGFGDVSIQRVGGEADHEYMIRLQDPGKDPEFSKTIIPRLTAELGRPSARTTSSSRSP